VTVKLIMGSAEILLVPRDIDNIGRVMVMRGEGLGDLSLVSFKGSI
jgi:hypothetical protein